MEKISDTYFLELENAFDSQDQNTVKQIFNKIEAELEKIRKEKSVKTERNKLVWGDSKLHFNAVMQEELADLKMEYDDNLELFQLASIFRYEPVMEEKFAQMINNFCNIRKRTNVRIAGSEINDLMSLYNIARSVNYTQGIILIANRLKKIAPSLVDSLIPENSNPDINNLKDGYNLYELVNKK